MTRTLFDNELHGIRSAIQTLGELAREATARAVQAAGGSIMVPPMPVGSEGTMLVAVDSAGAVIGFWQPDEHHGFSQRGEHGTPYWFESHSTDYAKSVDFYTRVLGARIEEVGTGGDPDAVGPDVYGQVFTGDLAYMGIMDSAKILPAGTGSFWQVYVTVDDVADTVAQVESLGGSVLMGPEVTPYGTLATSILSPQPTLLEGHHEEESHATAGATTA